MFMMIFLFLYCQTSFESFFSSDIFINGWYSSCLTCSKNIFCKKMDRNSNDSVASSLLVSASATTLSFSVWNSSLNETPCTFKVHQTCHWFVIYRFWKYVRFLWSITTWFPDHFLSSIIIISSSLGFQWLYNFVLSCSSCAK